MTLYRVRLTRLLEQQTYLEVTAPTPEAAAIRALEQVDGDLLWIESRYARSHAVDDVVNVQIGQFEAGAYARDQRLQRK